jgi:hypothetical protein
MQLHRGDDLEALWATEPDSELYRLKSARTKPFTSPAVEAETALTTSLLPREVPPPPELIFYRVFGVGCGGSEGP